VRREKPIAIILVVFAIVFVVIGIMYVTILPKNLPSFMPGHVSKKPAATKPHTTATNAAGATVTTKAPGATTKPKAKAQAAKKATTKYYWKRGVASFFVALVLLVVAWSISNTRRRYRHRH
jgi:hypothetical protein